MEAHTAKLENQANTENKEDLEVKHFKKIINSFRYYRYIIEKPDKAALTECQHDCNLAAGGLVNGAVSISGNMAQLRNRDRKASIKITVLLEKYFLRKLCRRAIVILL